MAYISTYNPPSILRNDTLDKIRFTLTVNDSPQDLTGIAIKCQFRKSNNLFKTLEIGTGITVITAASGIFEIDAFIVDFPIGSYNYDIQFTESGVVKTYIKGALTVTQDITL